MRNIIILILLIGFNIICQADNITNSKDSSWYNSAKKNAGEIYDKTKEAASVGIDKTTNFINKTGQATKQGYNAFKKSFADEKAIKNNNRALPPMYLSVKGYEFCVAIKELGSSQIYCLPKYRSKLCLKNIFEKLQSLNSPKPC